MQEPRPNSLPHSPARLRVCVVGGGVVGCAVAYRLSRNGCGVTLIERDGIAAHASGCNAGNINPLHGTAPALMPFAMHAFRLHRSLRADVAPFLRAAAQPVRRLHLGFAGEDRAEIARTEALFNAADGFTARWVDPAELPLHDARLAGDIDCALLTEGNVAIDSADFARALGQAAVALGATIVHAAATGLATRGDRVTGVRTDAGDQACDALVLATGPWTREVNEWLGIEVPVSPLKGEMLLVRLAGGPPPFDCSWRGTSLYRRHGRDFWVGTTQAQAGFDTTPSMAARAALLAACVRMMPAMAGAEVLQHGAALRPMSRQGLPLAERASGWANAFIANGGGAKGVLLCAAIADAIGHLLAGERENAALPALSA